MTMTSNGQRLVNFLCSAYLAIFTLVAAGPAAQPGPPSPHETLFVHETEGVSVETNPLGCREVAIRETLGLARISPAGREQHFTAKLTKRLPKGLTIPGFERGTLSGMTFFKELMSIQVTRQSLRDGSEAAFVLAGVPCVTPEEHKKHHGVDLCGKACGVTVSFEGRMADFDPNRYVSTRLSVSPTELRGPGRQTVTVKVDIKLSCPAEARYWLTVPTRWAGAEMGVAEVLPVLRLSDDRGAKRVHGMLTGRSATATVTLAVTPSKPGTLRLPGFVTVMLRLPETILPPITVSGTHPVEYTSRSSLTVKHSLVLAVSEP